MKEAIVLFVSALLMILANAIQTIVQEWLRKRGAAKSHQQIADKVADRVIEVTSIPRIPIANPTSPPSLPGNGNGNGPTTPRGDS